MLYKQIVIILRGSDGRAWRGATRRGRSVALRRPRSFEELEKEATKERKFKRGWKTIRFHKGRRSFPRAARRGATRRYYRDD